MYRITDKRASYTPIIIWLPCFHTAGKHYASCMPLRLTERVEEQLSKSPMEPPSNELWIVRNYFYLLEISDHIMVLKLYHFVRLPASTCHVLG